MLHVFKNDVVDWFVAETAEEAKRLSIAYAKECGIDVELYDVDDNMFTQERDDKRLTINDDSESGKTTKTCAEWAAQNGKGFLCSTEY